MNEQFPTRVNRSSTIQLFPSIDEENEENDLLDDSEGESKNEGKEISSGTFQTPSKPNVNENLAEELKIENNPDNDVVKKPGLPPPPPPPPPSSGNKRRNSSLVTVPKALINRRLSNNLIKIDDNDLNINTISNLINNPISEDQEEEGDRFDIQDTIPFLFSTPSQRGLGGSNSFIARRPSSISPNAQQTQLSPTQVDDNNNDGNTRLASIRRATMLRRPIEKQEDQVRPMSLRRASILGNFMDFLTTILLYLHICILYLLTTTDIH